MAAEVLVEISEFADGQMHTKALSMEKIAKKKKLSIGSLNIRAVFTKSGEGAPIYQQERSRSNTMAETPHVKALDGTTSQASATGVKPSKTEVNFQNCDPFSG